MLVAGLTITAPATKSVLIRGLGPRLAFAPFNFSEPLARSSITVSDSKGRVWARNEGWRPILNDTFARVGALSLASGSNDAALLLTLPPGTYTVVLAGTHGATGQGMLEIFDVE